jgi:hypothetical protein
MAAVITNRVIDRSVLLKTMPEKVASEERHARTEWILAKNFESKAKLDRSPDKDS